VEQCVTLSGETSVPQVSQAEKRKKLLKCQVCGKLKSPAEVMPAEMVRPAVAELIRQSHRDWSTSGFVCLTDLDAFRAQCIQQVLEAEKGELSNLEGDVLRSFQQQELLAENTNEQFERAVTLGARLADRIAEFGGSWRFILIFATLLLTWIAINSLLIVWRPFDPYPFILLNLVLSCLAAVQAPVIMMSQNRQEAKDRLRAEHDYRINLKAEIEIRHLHAKLDLLLSHQWQRLLEIQELQVDLMDELVRASDKAS